MKVRAKFDGFYNGHRVRAGTVFVLLTGHRIGRWMEEVPADVPETPPQTRPRPYQKPAPAVSLSELARAQEKRRAAIALKKGIDPSLIPVTEE